MFFYANCRQEVKTLKEKSNNQILKSAINFLEFFLVKLIIFLKEIKNFENLMNWRKEKNLWYLVTIRYFIFNKQKWKSSDFVVFEICKF